jgi:Tfp pilus assembly protein PilO
MEFNLDALLYTLRSAPEIIGILLVGGVVVGLPLAAVGYFFALKTIVEYRASIQQKLEEKKANLAKKLKRAKPRRKNKKRRR